MLKASAIGRVSSKACLIRGNPFRKIEGRLGIPVVGNLPTVVLGISPLCITQRAKIVEIMLMQNEHNKHLLGIEQAIEEAPRYGVSPPATIDDGKNMCLGDWSERSLPFI